MSEVKKGNGLVYKNHPLRRVDNLIYYGSMADKYIVLLQILDTKKEQDMDVATRVSVQLQMTDPDLKSRDRVVKKSEKDSLYAAMDVGCSAPWPASKPIYPHPIRSPVHEAQPQGGCRCAGGGPDPVPVRHFRAARRAAPDGRHDL